MIENEVKKKIIERKVGDLHVDPNVQRSVSRARVNQMAGSFDPDALGVLTTSRRTGGLIYVVDGQHRLRAAEAANYDGALRTLEYAGLTLAQEAALFRKLNSAQKPTRSDLFLVALVEGRASALYIAKAMDEHGWKLGASASDGYLSAIGALESLYAVSPEAVDGVLEVVTRAWGHRTSATQGCLLEGIGRVLAHHRGVINVGNLIERLAKFPGGPESLIGYARGRAFSRGGKLNVQVSRVVVEVYNERRKGTALPEWK